MDGAILVVARRTGRWRRRGSQHFAGAQVGVPSIVGVHGTRCDAVEDPGLLELVV